VAEGSNKNVDRSLEQALTSTSLENGFLIQETSNLAETASFLDSITKHLKQRLKTEKVCRKNGFNLNSHYRLKVILLLGFRMRV
jgi:ERCC4-type nuclease